MIYTGIYRAKVVDNDDSGEKYPYYGKVKVIVPEIHGDSVPKSDLPWAYPVLPYGNGKDADSYDYTAINIPKEETWVWVIFEHGDKMRPCYIGGWIGGEESELPEIFMMDSRSGNSVRYPDIRGWTFGFAGGSFSLRIVGERRLEIFFDENNIIEVDAQGDSPNEEKQICIRSEWLIRQKSDKKIRLEAPEIEIEASSKVSIQGDAEVDINTPVAIHRGGVMRGASTVLGTLKHPVE